MDYEMDGIFFESAEQALFWSADMLRVRRFPKISSVWREMLREDDEATVVALNTEGRGALLPPDFEGKYALALTLDALLWKMELPGMDLRLYAWGDWWNEGALKGSLGMQEKLRQQGIKARLALRYSFRQLGLLWHCDHKTAAKRVRLAMAVWEEALVGRGWLGKEVSGVRI